MKKFFYLAMAVMTALCTTACGDDDEDNGGGNGNSNTSSAIVTPKYANNACAITPASALEVDGIHEIEEITFTESGKTYVLVRDDKGSETYINDNYTYSDGTYRMSGNKVVGTVKVNSPSRASENVSVDINIKIAYASGIELKYNTEQTGAVKAVKTVTTKSGDKDIISTWKVRGMILDLEGDVNVFKKFPTGDLKAIRDEAIAQGAEMTAEEMEDFEKEIVSVSINGGMIAIDYSDGTSDGGGWEWTNGSTSQFLLILKNQDMGNKFIVDNAKVDVEFQKANAYMNLTLNADITGNKNYKAKITIQLQQVAEAK